MKIQKILLPVEIDEPDKGLLPVVWEWAQNFKAEVHFLYVNPPGAGYRVAFDHEDEVALYVKQTLSEDMLSTLPHVYAVSQGDIGDCVDAYVRSQNMDMVIVGHTHHSLLGGFLSKAGDEDIVEQVNVPVLVIPKKSM